MSHNRAPVHTMLVPLQADASDLGLASSSYDWAGAYLGGNAGGSLDDMNVQRKSLYTGLLPLPPADRLLYNAARDDLSGQSSGFTGGVMAGYNWQMEQVVFGIEADINALSLSGTMKRDVSSAFSALFNDPDIEAQDKVSYEIDTFGTLRGRLGFAIENVMLYGTGGLAYAHAKTESDLYVQDGSGGARWASSASDWNLGWTVGGGL